MAVLQTIVPEVGNTKVLIDISLRNNLLPALLVGEEFDANFRKILGHSITCGEIGIPETQRSEESSYITSKDNYGELLGSIVGGIELKYIGHRE